MFKSDSIKLGGPMDSLRKILSLICPAESLLNVKAHRSATDGDDIFVFCCNMPLFPGIPFQLKENYK